MSEPIYKKASIRVEIDEPQDVAAVYAWLDKWETSFRHKNYYGCGCHLLLYDVLAPIEAVNELPERVLAETEWTRDASNTSPGT